MLADDELDKAREEFEVIDRWRKYSRHVVAQMLEACDVCGMVREKERLIRCRWCKDLYCCEDGLCSHRHLAEVHPAAAEWIW